MKSKKRTPPVFSENMFLYVAVSDISTKERTNYYYFSRLVRIAQTVCSDLNFDRMKPALKRIFSKSSLNPNDNVKTKQEEAFYSKILNIKNVLTILNKSTN